MYLFLQTVAEDSTTPLLRIAIIAGAAAGLHIALRLLRRTSEWIVTPDSSPEIARELFSRRRPRTATVTTLVVSAVTFAIYFVAIGQVADELGLPFRTYFASATVIGLAVGFGSQGLVQDVVIGLTLIFSEAFNVGDIVEVSGQVGRVDKVGLRFTTLSNFLGQTVFIPNRNIGVIGRYSRGAIAAYVDVQLPASTGDEELMSAIANIARGMRAQQPAILLTEPEVLGPFTAEPGDWRFIRVKFRVWPGQGAFIEGAFRQRALAMLRSVDPTYADWMITVTYRVAA